MPDTLHSKQTRNWRFSFKALFFHFVISMVLMALLSVLVFAVWYPAPYFDLMGSWHLILMIAGVDLVCGPILTLIAANSNKSRQELIRDFAIIAVIQLCALAYGIYALAQSRPVADVFDKDRFYVVTALQIEPERLKKAPEGMNHLPLFGIIKAGTRDAQNNKEFLDGIDLSLAGIPPAARPDWWTPENDAADKIAKAKLPLSKLLAAKPDTRPVIENALKQKNIDELYYLPFTAEKNLDWIVILDKNNQRLAYAPVDGFSE